MNRNHPYAVKVVPVQYNPENFGSLNLPTPTATTTAPKPINHIYHPRMAPLAHPMWNENTSFIRTLNKMFEVSCYNPCNGYHVDSSGLIYDPATSEEASAGVISAVAIGVDTTKDSDRMITSCTHVVNTEDYGLRYVCHTKDGKMLDLGPVEHACIIGNNDRPEGVYVPMCNTKAMADGITMLKEFFKVATEDNKDLPPFEDDEELPAPDYHHDHKCICGGNCKCKK